MGVAIRSPWGGRENCVRDVDGGTVHSTEGERFVESTACFPNERHAQDHLCLAGRLSHDDAVRPVRAVPCHKGTISKGAVAAVSERSLGIHAEILGIRAGDIE